MGRTARGVRGIRLKEGSQVISLIIPEENVRVLCGRSAKGTVSDTDMEEFQCIIVGGSASSPCKPISVTVNW